MEYAIKVLEDEKLSIEKALKGWISADHKEAFKIRESRLKDLKKALELIRIMKLPI